MALTWRPYASRTCGLRRHHQSAESRSRCVPPRSRQRCVTGTHGEVHGPVYAETSTWLVLDVIFIFIFKITLSLYANRKLVQASAFTGVLLAGMLLERKHDLVIRTPPGPGVCSA